MPECFRGGGHHGQRSGRFELGTAGADVFEWNRPMTDFAVVPIIINTGAALFPTLMATEVPSEHLGQD
jgi:hypothetical protein